MAITNGTKKVTIEIDSTELSSAHVRMLKTLNSLITHVLVTDEEGEYFDGSAEAIRMCAALIKQARFIEGVKGNEIPYADQALEFSIDVLHEHINSSRVVTYDN